MRHLTKVLVLIAIAVFLWPLPVKGQTPAPLEPSPGSAARPPDPAPPSPAPRQVLAYYVSWDARSWASLERNASSLDYVAAQWVTLDMCGNIGSRDDQTLKRFARANGIKVLPSLVTFSGALNHSVIADTQRADNAIAQIVDYIVDEDYDGFDLDLEGVNAADRDHFTTFVAVLAEKLHDRGKLLTLAIPPKPYDVRVGWAGAYDYAALGQYVDLITFMTYEYSGVWSGPGSVAPYNRVDADIAFATSQMPPEKVLLGLGWYGYDWNTTFRSARAIGYPEAAAIRDRYQASMDLDPATQSATFRYRAPFGDRPASGLQAPSVEHDITVRRPAACSIPPPPPPPAPSPRPTPPANAMQNHEVWIDESGSTAARLTIADRYSAGGVGAWRLGQEDPAVWPLLDWWSGADKGP